MPLPKFNRMYYQSVDAGRPHFWSDSFSLEDVLKISAQYPDIRIEAHSGGYLFD